MISNLWEEISGKGAGTVGGMIVGGAVTWALARWQRRREWQKILQGDARDTVVIHQHLVESEEFADPADAARKRRLPTVLRIRSLGQGSLKHVVPNGHLADVLLSRARQVTPRQTLISMEGGEGSYLLETLTGYVCDRVGNAPFDHDLYVMAPCCEPKELAHHQPITVLLIAAADLQLFEKWTECRNVQVEHGGDGARVLTLMALAQRHRAEQEKIAQVRQQGQRTKYLETMYLLDLPLDRRTAKLPVKKVPWGRFEAVLKQLNLESAA